MEADFYSQTDNAGNISPLLRLANVKYSPNNNRTTLTAGMDWTPIMSSHLNLIDFSIMGYNGNLWQRLPQITLKHQFTDNVSGLLTVMRFERGLSAIQPQTLRRTFQGAGAATAVPGSGGSGFACSENAFNDPVQMPYVGTRFAYMGTGQQAGLMVALNAAFRYYRSAPTAGGIPSDNDINSYLVGAELSVPLTSRLKFTGEIAYGQALGVEFFRYGQERNLGTGKAIRTVSDGVSWTLRTIGGSRSSPAMGSTIR